MARLGCMRPHHPATPLAAVCVAGARVYALAPGPVPELARPHTPALMLVLAPVRERELLHLPSAVMVPWQAADCWAVAFPPRAAQLLAPASRTALVGRTGRARASASR